ncbi:ATP-binding protein [Streptomyces coacervatus]|uniref:ATP-binding protein n=1 Tax=Streptomyces coacervatus TaxID=647381 RepID=A0ABP7H6X6_9ACTN|nr:ATP-binding protein [Streptomyces coacervatus]MDF2267393.1 ATP-binding protein [Streptomyces coacervatus]
MIRGHSTREQTGVGTRPHVQRRTLILPTAPASVRAARISTAEVLTLFGLAPGSLLADAALLVVSELMTNAVRHAAPHSPSATVTVSTGAGQLVVVVGDQDPHTVDLAGASVGGGLRTVAEMTAYFDGEVSVEPASWGRGKTVVARFRLPWRL